ncbi:MAG: PKD domain-containing protein [Candidatus Moduliflexus flocculans]|nr:PKD domain-containing protein [Candidatus Moduliflexus flocculans]
MREGFDDITPHAYQRLVRNPARSCEPCSLCATAVSWLSAPAAAQKSINRLAQLSGSDFRVALSLSPTVPIQGQPVSFTGASTGDVRFWLWDFGDGWTSTRQNEVHTYRKAGFYKVSLTATGPTGTKKTLRTFAVMPETLAASFVFSPTSPGVGQTVSFADTTLGRSDVLGLGFRGRDDEHRRRIPPMPTRRPDPTP